MPAILRAEGARQSAAARADATRLPCCVVNARPAPVGGVRFALANRSCCDLRIQAARGPLPPGLPATTPKDTAALLPAAPVLPAWIAILAADATPRPARQSIPRAPPRRALSPRAPPAFS